MHIHVAPHLSDVLRETTRPPSDPRRDAAGRHLHLRDLLDLAAASWIALPCRCKDDLMLRMRNALTPLASKTRQNCMKTLILHACTKTGLKATTGLSLGSPALLLVRMGSPGRTYTIAHFSLIPCREGQVFACSVYPCKATAGTDHFHTGTLYGCPGRLTGHAYHKHL